ncbi:MAG: SpoIIE family protein phosphatase [Pirellula sp.]|jgi:sigma-B regulation protein RsbU (phosphoserine phosphatase)
MPYFDTISGPALGRRIQLDRPEYVMGRHPECDIVLESGAVSRQHAKAIQAPDGYLIEDLGSRNGTFVNGKLISGATKLQNGDTIRICDIELEYCEESEASGLTVSAARATTNSNLGIEFVEDEESDVGARSVTGKIDVRGSQFGVQLAASAEARLAAILEIMKSLGKAVSLEEVLPKVLDSLFAIFIQADRGFIVLKDETGNIAPRWSKARRPDQEEKLRISRTVLREVMQSKEAIISLDAGSDSRFDGSQSVADFKIRSMIVAPLLDSEGESIGAIQIDTVQQKGGFEAKDLEILVGVANQAGIAIENAQLHERMVAQKLVEQDLELARQVQMAFLPRRSPEIPEYSFYQYYNPAQQIGGDYFDYLELDENRIVIALADVVGHGVAAAMFMAKLSAETRFAFASIDDPRKAMAQLNDRITALEAERFITMSVIVLDKSTHKATIVIAGHMPPIMYTKDGVVTEPGSEIGGPPLGIMSDIEFDSFELDLHPGESLTMYTDGIFEAPNSRHEQFSIERVRQHIELAKGDVTKAGEELISRVKQHIVGCEQEDDMCLVIVGRKS